MAQGVALRPKGNPSDSPASGSELAGIFFARLTLALILLAPLDSTALRTIGVYDPVSAATDVHGSLAYVAGPDGLRVLDVSDPRRPVVIGALVTPAPATAVDVVGTTAYLGSVQGAMGGALHVVDVSDASFPVELAALETAAPVDVEVAGDVVYLATRNGLSLIDVSDAVRPVALAEIPLGFAHDVEVVGSLAYVAAGGLFVIDGSTPGDPAVLGSLSASLDARGVAVAGSLAYVAGAGLRVVDISDPRQLRSIGGSGSGSLSGVAAAEELVLATALDELLAFDVSDPAHPEPLGRIATGRIIDDVELARGVAYVAGGAGLRLIDTSESRYPVMIGTLEAPAATRDVEVEGDLAYVAAGAPGPFIFDVADPRAPVALGSVPGSGAVVDVEVASGVAYLADDLLGLRTIDIGNSSNPAELGAFDAAGPVVDVEVVGSLAYLAEGPGDTQLASLRIIDISDPEAPVEIGASEIGPGRIVDLEVVGSRAYLIDGDEGVVHVRDVSDPTRPRVEAPFQLSCCINDLELVDNLLYAVGQGGMTVWRQTSSDVVQIGETRRTGTTDIEVAGTIAYVLDSRQVESLVAIAVSDPTRPVVLGRFDLPGPAADDLKVIGDLVFVSNADGGLRVIDVADPSQLTEIGFFDSPGSATDVEVRDGIAYLADREGGLRIVAISDPSQPQEVAALENPAPAHDLEIRDGLAFAADDAGGLKVFDVSDSSNPFEIAALASEGAGSDIDLVGDLAVLAVGPAGSRLVNLRDPADPRAIVKIGTLDFASAVAVARDHLYVADGRSGLRIFDIASPSAPVEVGALETDFAYDVEIADGFAYVADLFGGLRVVDVSDPTEPLEVQHVAMDFARDVALVGHLAYVADSLLLRVFDASDPSELREIGAFRTDVEDIEVVGTLAYVASGLDDIGIVDFGPEYVSNGPPRADAGVDQFVECSGFEGARIVLDGTRSSDPDGDPLAFVWRTGAGDEALGPNPTVVVPLGDDTITLEVRDPFGATDSASVDVRVEDSRPPEVRASLRPLPSGGARFRAEFSCSDVCDADPVATASVNDRPVEDGQIIVLEAGRSEAGKGPRSRLEVICQDASGNSAHRSVLGPGVGVTPAAEQPQSPVARSPYGSTSGPFASRTASAPRAHSGRVIVKLRAGVPSDAPGNAASLRSVRTVKKLARGVQTVESVDGSRSLEEVIAELESSPLVEYAEPDYLMHADTLFPNDPRFAELWGLHNIGQQNGTPDADVDAPEAWSTTTGDAVVVVGVIDTGVDYTHEDLASNMWRNPDELVNGIDDDGNGYVDDLHGIDCIAGTGNPRDANGHGTHVAGTIGAVGDNAVGVAGVGWDLQIMALRFLGSSGAGFASDAIECLDYARSMRLRGTNIRVTNNSWGGADGSRALREAIEAGGEVGMLFVAAAGNDATDSDASPHYPSAFDLDAVVSVAATDRNDELAAFSNFGMTSVDLGAPGDSILSTWLGNGYQLLSGTSMAAPHVSGAAALILGLHPDASASAVKTLLLAAADPVSSLPASVLKAGRLNLAGVVCEPGEYRLLIVPGGGFEPRTDEPTRVEAAPLDCVSPLVGESVTASFSDGGRSLLLHDDGVVPDEHADDGVYTALWPHEGSGLVRVSVQAGPASRSVTWRRSPYRMTDDRPFEWVDTTLGSLLPLADDDSVEIPIGFHFEFFGVARETLSVSSNGYLAFGPDPTQFWNSAIPERPAPSDLIAPGWDDLDPSAGGEVVALLEGDPSDRSLTVEWRDVPYYAETARTTFQATLYEADHRIVFRYLDVAEDSEAHGSGASATAGIEDAAGRRGHQYSFNSPRLRPGLSIEFSITSGCADADADGVCNADDNCPQSPNPDQPDRGGVGSAEPDGIGDVCQCGDVDDDGIVGHQDFVAIRQWLGPGRSDPARDSFREERCDVSGDGLCGLEDFELVQRAVTRGTADELQLSCPAATSP